MRLLPDGLIETRLDVDRRQTGIILAAAERFHQIDRGDEPLAFDLRFLPCIG